VKTVQLVEIKADLLADLAGRYIGAVIAEDPPRRQQHRRERLPNLFDANALFEQPRDQLGSLGACPTGQSVE
jgi:hypothetical protein